MLIVKLKLHPHTQGSVERANDDFQPMLGTWMRENKNPNWSIGLYIVQHQKNRKYHSGIKTTPYNMMFGHEAYNGLEITNLPRESKEKIKTIKDLYAIFTGIFFLLYFSLLFYSPLFIN